MNKTTKQEEIKKFLKLYSSSTIIDWVSGLRSAYFVFKVRQLSFNFGWVFVVLLLESFYQVVLLIDASSGRNQDQKKAVLFVIHSPIISCLL